MTVPEIRLSAFGEVRTVEPRTLFGYSSPFGIDLGVWGTQVVAGGAVSDLPLLSAFKLATGTGATDAARARTHERFRYQPGRGARVRLTGFCDVKAGLPGRVYRWGQYDETDGWSFAVIDGTLYVEKKTSTGGPSPVRVAQSAWNVDRMDGTGTSGRTLDWSKGHIWEARYAWLGVGPLSFFVDGIEVHRFEHGQDALAEGDAGGGSAQRPWIRRANLPISAEVVNASGPSASGYFVLICVEVASEGGDELSGPSFAYVAPTPIAIDASPSERAIFAMRLKSAFKGDADHGVQAWPTWLSANAEGGRAALRVYMNPTLTAVGTPVWVSANDESAVEVWNNAAAEAGSPRIDPTITGGTLLFRATLGGDTNGSLQFADLRAIFSRLGRRLRRKAYGTDPALPSVSGAAGDLLVVTMIQLSASPSCTAAIGWEESR